MMEIPLDEVVYFDVITSTPSTGAAVDADSTPTFAVYEESTDTDIGVGGNLTKRTSLTGNYRGSFTASAANGFELGKWYSVIASATVGAVVGKCRAMGFRLAAAENVAGFRTVDTTKVSGTAQTAGDIPARLPAALVGGRMDSSTGAMANDVMTAAAAAPDLTTELQNGLATATALATAKTAIDNIKTVTDKFVFTVTGFVDANTLKVGGTTQTAGDLYAILTAIGAYIDTEITDIQNRLPAALVGGRMDSNIGSLDSIVITADALDNSVGEFIGATVWNQDITGYITANGGSDFLVDIKALLAAISVPTAAQNATAVLTTIMTESYAADGVAPTLAQAIFLTMQSLTEAALAGTTLTVKKLDGLTTAATFTLNSATNPTSRTRTT